MRKVSGRAKVVILLALLVLGGLTAFFVQYLLRAGDWVTFPAVLTSTPATT